MQLTLQIPDDLAQRLSTQTGDLSRRALESFAVEEYKSGRITEAELRRMVGFESRKQTVDFLKTYNVHCDYALHDPEQDQHNSYSSQRQLPEPKQIRAEEFEAALDRMAQFSDKIPALPLTAFSRENLYKDCDK